MTMPKLAEHVFNSDRDNMEIISLVYVSETLRPITPSELEKLEQKSRSNNARLDVNGLLMYRAGRFMQLLEGPELFVMALFGRICRDARHHRITKILHERIDRPMFGEWSFSRHDTVGSPALSMNELVASLYEANVSGAAERGTAASARGDTRSDQSNLHGRVLKLFQLFENQPLSSGPTPQSLLQKLASDEGKPTVKRVA